MSFPHQLAPLCALALAACSQPADTHAERAAATVAANPASPASAPAATPALAASSLDALVTPRQPGRFAPRDDCAGVPGARRFREALSGAVERRDSAALLALALPEVRLGFGGNDGADNLRQRLSDEPGVAFGEIGAALRLGCAVGEGGMLVMPWFFAQDSGVDDPFAAMIVTGVGVPLREVASANGKVLETIDWDIVTLDGGLAQGSFQKVTSAAGTSGYVATSSLRSLLDTRLLAERRDGQWKLAAIVAGD